METPEVDPYEDLVAREVRGQASSSELEELHSDLDQWLIVLNHIKRNVELRLTAQKDRLKILKLNKEISHEDFLEILTKEHERKLKARRFEISVEKRIMEVKKLKSKK